MKKLKSGFSLVEVMMLFLAMAILMAATMPMITRKSRAIPTKVPHGMYRCIPQRQADGSVKYLQEWYSAKQRTHFSNGASECRFDVPNASLYKVDLYGAGAGGIDTFNFSIDNNGNEAKTGTFSLIGGEISGASNTEFKNLYDSSGYGKANPSEGELENRAKFEKIIYDLFAGEHGEGIVIAHSLESPGYNNNSKYNSKWGHGGKSAGIKAKIRYADGFSCVNPWARKLSEVAKIENEAAKLKADILYQAANNGNPKLEHPGHDLDAAIEANMIHNINYYAPGKNGITSDSYGIAKETWEKLRNDYLEYAAKIVGNDCTTLSQNESDFDQCDYNETIYMVGQWNSKKSDFLSRLNSAENNSSLSANYFKKRYGIGGDENKIGHGLAYDWDKLDKLLSDDYKGKRKDILNTRIYDAYNCLDMYKEDYFNNPFYKEEYVKVKTAESLGVSCEDCLSLSRNPINALIEWHYLKSSSNPPSVNSIVKYNRDGGAARLDKISDGTDFVGNLQESGTESLYNLISEGSSTDVATPKVDRAESKYQYLLMYLFPSGTFRFDEQAVARGEQSIMPYLKALKNNNGKSHWAYATFGSDKGIGSGSNSIAVKSYDKNSPIQDKATNFRFYKDSESVGDKGFYQCNGSPYDVYTYGHIGVNAETNGVTHDDWKQFIYSQRYTSSGSLNDSSAPAYDLSGISSAGISLNPNGMSKEELKTYFDNMHVINIGASPKVKKSFMIGDEAYGLITRIYAGNQYNPGYKNINCYTVPISPAKDFSGNNISSINVSQQKTSSYGSIPIRLKQVPAKANDDFGVGVDGDLVYYQKIDTEGNEIEGNTVPDVNKAASATFYESTQWENGGFHFYKIYTNGGAGYARTIEGGDQYNNNSTRGYGYTPPSISISEIPRTRLYTIGAGGGAGEHKQEQYISLGNHCKITLSSGGLPININYTEYNALSDANARIKNAEKNLTTTITCYKDSQETSESVLFTSSVAGGQYGQGKTPTEMGNSFTSASTIKEGVNNCTKGNLFCTFKVESALGKNMKEFFISALEGISVNLPSRSRFMAKIRLLLKGEGGSGNLNELRVSYGGSGVQYRDRCLSNISRKQYTLNYRVPYIFRDEIANIIPDLDKNTGKLSREYLQDGDIDENDITNITAGAVECTEPFSKEEFAKRLSEQGLDGNPYRYYVSGVNDQDWENGHRRININKYPANTYGGPGAVVITW